MENVVIAVAAALWAFWSLSAYVVLWRASIAMLRFERWLDARDGAAATQPFSDATQRDGSIARPRWH